MDDIDLMIDYFLNADKSFLEGMGVDESKLPKRLEWREMILADLEKSLKEKKFHYLLWELDSKPVGHSNINRIVFGTEAYMHLHIWNNDGRERGNGYFFINKCVDEYFRKFDLQRLLCEPYSENPAPNRLLARLGFEKVKTYDTVPGWINFPQTVNRWLMSRQRWFENSEKFGQCK